MGVLSPQRVGRKRTLRFGLGLTPDNRNAVAFVDRKTGRRLEQGFSIPPVQRHHEKRSRGDGLELSDGRAHAPAAFFRGDHLDLKPRARNSARSEGSQFGASRSDLRWLWRPALTPHAEYRSGKARPSWPGRVSVQILTALDAPHSPPTPVLCSTESTEERNVIQD
jgi:hypothetical protein